VAESGTTPAPQAQHVRQAAAGETSRPAEASEPGGIRRRRDWAREVLDVHVVRANGSDSLEVLRDLVHGIEQRGVTRPVELLREKDVLGDLNGVLQQPMDEATSIPTRLRRCLMVWVATSPMCATNFSFRLSA